MRRLRVGLTFGDQLPGNTAVSVQVENLQGHKRCSSVGSLMWYLDRNDSILSLEIYFTKYKSSFYLTVVSITVNSA